MSGRPPSLPPIAIDIRIIRTLCFGGLFAFFDGMAFFGWTNRRKKPLIQATNFLSSFAFEKRNWIDISSQTLVSVYDRGSERL
jgi:hypothetical protein